MEFHNRTYLFIEGEISAREASATFGIPRSTLGDKLAGKSKPTLVKKGKVTVFKQRHANDVCNQPNLLTIVSYYIY